MTSRTTYDPNYHPESLYANTKLFALLYDEIYLWYPVQKIAETYIDTNELLRLVELGIITPIGESKWWDRESRKEWPSFIGEFKELDRQIAKTGRFLKFEDLIGEEYLFKKRVERLAEIDSQNQAYQKYVHQLGIYPYKHNFRSHEPSNWFARCFHAHRLLSDKLSSYELVAENHQPVWKYLVQTTVVKELLKVRRTEGNIAKLLKRSENMRAIITFMEDQQLYLPKNMTVNEIEKFREESAAEEFRKFLENAYETAQGRYDFDFKEQLILDFNKLSRGYKSRREIATVTLSSALTGAVVALATLENPALGAGLGAGIAGSWHIITKKIQNLYDEAIGKKFSAYSWVFHLAKIRP